MKDLELGLLCGEHVAYPEVVLAILIALLSAITELGLLEFNASSHHLHLVSKPVLGLSKGCLLLDDLEVFLFEIESFLADLRFLALTQNESNNLLYIQIQRYLAALKTILKLPSLLFNKISQPTEIFSQLRSNWLCRVLCDRIPGLNGTESLVTEDLHWF